MHGVQVKQRQSDDGRSKFFACLAFFSQHENEEHLQNDCLKNEDWQRCIPESDPVIIQGAFPVIEVADNANEYSDPQAESVEGR